MTSCQSGGHFRFLVEDVFAVVNHSELAKARGDTTLVYEACQQVVNNLVMVPADSGESPYGPYSGKKLFTAEPYFNHLIGKSTTGPLNEKTWTTLSSAERPTASCWTTQTSTRANLVRAWPPA